VARDSSLKILDTGWSERNKERDGGQLLTSTPRGSRVFLNGCCGRNTDSIYLLACSHTCTTMPEQAGNHPVLLTAQFTSQWCNQATILARTPQFSPSLVCSPAASFSTNLQHGPCLLTLSCNLSSYVVVKNMSSHLVRVFLNSPFSFLFRWVLCPGTWLRQKSPEFMCSPSLTPCLWQFHFAALLD
jgi:hypothetical protein